MHTKRSWVAASVIAASVGLLGCGGAAPDDEGDVTEAALSATVRLDVPWIAQKPELPRGCEVTALAMMLRYSGVDADKLTLAAQIDKVPYLVNGLHGNPHVGFVGDMYTFSKPGYGVYHEPVERLAARYRPGNVTKLTGASFGTILSYVGRGQPVWVITNATFAKLPSSAFTTWKTATGDVQITWSEHAVVVTGYDPSFVYVNDPLGRGANEKLARGPFADAWVQMGSQAFAVGGAAALPCVVKSDARLYCSNSPAAPMHATATSESAVVNTLRSTYSWFTCWTRGELHAGGNTTWYYTIGDDNGDWGFVPAVALQTTSAFDADPSAHGLPSCPAAAGASQ